MIPGDCSKCGYRETNETTQEEYCVITTDLVEIAHKRLYYDGQKECSSLIKRKK